MAQREEPLTARMRASRSVFSITFLSHQELMLFHEIFVRRIYDVTTDAKASFILDLGANIGISTLFFCSRFPHARVLAVEANPEIYKRLALLSEQCPQIIPIHAAVGGESGTRTFFISPHSSVASSVLHRTPDDQAVQVPSMTLGDIVSQYAVGAIDMLKFDIEGAEYELFKTFENKSIIRAFAGEVHEDLSGKTLKDFTGLFGNDFSIRVVDSHRPGRYIIHGTHNTNL